MYVFIWLVIRIIKNKYTEKIQKGSTKREEIKMAYLSHLYFAYLCEKNSHLLFNRFYVLQNNTSLQCKNNTYLTFSVCFM